MSTERMIVVATDFSDSSRLAAEQGARLARALGAGIVVVHAVEDRVHPMLDEKTRREVLRSHRRLADSAAEEWCRDLFEGCRVETCVLEGDPAEVIQDCADRWEADLVVVASHGHGALGRLLGSTADRVVHHSECPVLVVPAGRRVTD